MLAWTVYISFLGAALVFFVPARSRAVHHLALLTALVGLMLGLTAAVRFVPEAGQTTIVNVPWIQMGAPLSTISTNAVAGVPPLKISYYLATDGISLTMVLLTGIAAVAGILFSWNIQHRSNEFFAFYLALIGGVYGVFLSFDLFLLFVFYELAIIPKYFLIAIWGSTNREYGAMKLALYSFVGSAMVLVVMIAAYVVGGTFNLNELAAKGVFTREFQLWAFPVMFVGFAILAGLWPFHTWAPTGHVAAPTAASMLLAGVVMKLGAYGALRVSMTLFPQGLEAWRTVFATLAVIGIVYGALVALVQKDFKFVIGYSSVSHMGFVLLGLMTLTITGLSGAVLQMFSHGIIAGLLFGVVGRMVYERAHTRELEKLEVMNLGRAIPFAGVTFVIAGLASMGMPGFSGFVAELQVLMGAWKAFPTMTVITGFGILVGVAYTLRAIQKSFYSGASLTGGVSHEPLAPVSVAERVATVLLIGTTLLIGLFPGLLLKLIHSGLQTPLMAPLLKGGAP